MSAWPARRILALMLDWLLSSPAAVVLGPFLYALLFFVAAVVVNIVRMYFGRPLLWPRWKNGHVWPRWESDREPDQAPKGGRS